MFYSEIAVLLVLKPDLFTIATPEYSNYIPYFLTHRTADHIATEIESVCYYTPDLDQCPFKLGILANSCPIRHSIRLWLDTHPPAYIYQINLRYAF